MSYSDCDSYSDAGEATELHKAVMDGSLEDVHTLLASLDVDCRDENNWTPLHYAAEQGNLEIARLLLAHDADLEAKQNDFWTPLLVAIYSQHVDMVRLLLDRGANIEVKCAYGKTPLLMAVEYPSVEIVRLLLDHGADMKITRRSFEDKYTVLTTAIFRENWDMTKLLMDRGANIHDALYDLIHKDHVAGVRFLLSNEATVKEWSILYGSPLDCAKKRKCAEMIALLQVNNI